MADKWMTHPKGGVMKVQTSLQEESCLLHGWTYCDPPWTKAVSVVEYKPSSAPEPEPEVMIAPYHDFPIVPIDERDVLLKRAREMGLKVDGRWSLERLRREIANNEGL